MTGQGGQTERCQVRTEFVRRGLAAGAQARIMNAYAGQAEVMKSLRDILKNAERKQMPRK